MKVTETYIRCGRCRSKLKINTDSKYNLCRDDNYWQEMFDGPLSQGTISYATNKDDLADAKYKELFRMSNIRAKLKGTEFEDSNFWLCKKCRKSFIEWMRSANKKASDCGDDKDNQIDCL